MSAASGNTAPALSSITIFFFCWAVITFALRLWVKLPKRELWGVDDTVVAFALLAALGNVIATIHAVKHGYGSPWFAIADIEVAEAALYAGQLLYVLSMGGENYPEIRPACADTLCSTYTRLVYLTRLSNSLFAARFVTHAERHLRMARIITGMYGVWTIGSLFAIALRQPLPQPWRNRDGTQDMFIRWTIVEALGCFLDLGAVLFCAWLVWGLQMPVKRRLSVAGIFATRLLIWPIIAVRLFELSPGQSDHSRVPSIAAEILLEVAMETALNLASVTCLKPFLRPFQESGYIANTMANTSGNYGITGANRTRSEAYLMLGTAGSTLKNKDGSIIQSRSDKESGIISHRQNVPQPILRADVSDNQAACERDEVAHRNMPAKAIQVSRTVQVHRGGIFADLAPKH